MSDDCDVPISKLKKPQDDATESDSSDGEPIAKKRRISTSKKRTKKPATPKANKESHPKSAKKSTSARNSKPAADDENDEKAKKIFTKPRQTRETPNELDPFRLFYESLYKEKGSDSQMAERWCLIHGVLDDEASRRLDKLYGKTKITLTQPQNGEVANIRNKAEFQNVKKEIKREVVKKESDENRGSISKINKSKAKSKRSLEDEESSDEDIPLAAVAGPLNPMMEDDSDAPISSKIKNDTEEKITVKIEK